MSGAWISFRIKAGDSIMLIFRSVMYQFDHSTKLNEAYQALFSVKADSIARMDEKYGVLELSGPKALVILAGSIMEQMGGVRVKSRL